MTLIEKAEAELDMDEDKAKEMDQKMKKAKFDFDDYLESMKQMKKMGGTWQYHEHDAGTWRYGNGQDEGLAMSRWIDEKSYGTNGSNDSIP